MKKFFLLFLMSLFSFFSMGQTTLNPGDIVVVSTNGDVDAANSYGRGFSFMPLVDLSAGTVINFTDYGWSDITGAFITNTGISDAFIHYTAPGSVTAGTIIRCDSYVNNNFTFDYSYTGMGSNPYLNLAGLSSSDELLVFQGPRTSPTFICAVTFVTTGWATGVSTEGSDGASGIGSALPGSGSPSVADLVDDETALSFNQVSTANDNSSYSGPVTAATKADWQLRIKDYSNWTFNDAIPIPTPPVGPYVVLSTSVAPTVTTQAVSSIAATTATGNGNITSLGSPDPTAYGVCWNTTGTPTVSDSKVSNGSTSVTGPFTASMTSLTANTTYYVRAYATNTGGTIYGTEVSFTTLPLAPTVTTQASSSIGTTTATGNGNVTSLGAPNPTAHGVCWNTTGTPSILDSKVDNGAKSSTGNFTASMTSLSANTTYFVRAYATNIAGTSYGSEVMFTTSPIAPTVTTQAVSSITSTTATGNGNVTSLGAPNPSAHGVCWNTTGTPTVSDSKVNNGAKSSTGAFIAAMTSLSANTTYYVRAYATNIAGTSYGSEVSFTTAPVAPTVTTQAVSSITSTSATGNGNVTSLGVPNPTAHGVCWNTTGTPMVSDSKVNNGATSVTGAFTASITSLSANTTYYVRAYATNTGGTSYGTEVMFTTSPIAPTVTTQAVSSIASSTATGNGNVTSLGAPNPSAHGVCWNTTGTPTVSDSKVNNGAKSVTGAFTASMTSLSANTTYYVRAYATNTGGTSYGTEVSFTTLTANNAPTDLSMAGTSVNENVLANSAVGTLSTTDADAGNTFTYSLVPGAGSTDNASFTIIGNSLLINSSPDFETKNSFSVRIRTTDQGSLTFEEVFTITINDLNEMPVIPAAQTFTIDENLANSVTVGVIFATDQDAATTFSGWAITGGNTNNAFAIDASTGVVTVNNSLMLDRELVSSYSLTLTVSDGVNTSVPESVMVNLNDLNDISPLIIAAQEFTINENLANSSNVGTVVAIDGDVTPAIFSSWTITGGNTGNAFAIDASTGVVTVNNSAVLDRELVTSYNLTITVNDGIYASDPETLIVNLTDVNDEVPVITAAQVFHLVEQSPNGATVGTVLATDADVSATTFQNWTIIDGNSSGYFYLNPFTGVITVVDNIGLNPAINPSFTLTLSVSDGVNTSLPQTVSIIIDAVNDENPVVVASQSFSVDENSANNTVVGQVIATDPDYGTVFQGWSITSGNTGNAFAINATTGVITVTTSSVLDYESIPSFSLNIQVSDGLHTASAEVTITLNDVDEVALITTQAVSDITANTATGNGTITDLGSPDPTEYGVCWNTTGAPTTADDKTTQGAVSITGSFTSSMTSLNANTTYYVRAYVINAAGTNYGNEESFTTLAESISVAFNTSSSNGLESVSSANLQVNLSAVSGQDVTVDYTVTGTATGNGVDYTLADGTLTISAGNSSSNITIANIVDDLLVEGDETIIITLSNPNNATLGTNTVHTYTLNDNTTGVAGISEINLSVYPNPFTDNIHLDNLSDDISLIILCDLSGKIVLKAEYKGEKEVMVNHLISGAYVLTLVNSNGEKQMIKLVKE